MKIEQSTISSVSRQLSTDSPKPRVERDDDAAYTAISRRRQSRIESLEALSQLPVPIEILKEVQAHFLEDFRANSNAKDPYIELKAKVQVISTELRADTDAAIEAHSGLDNRSVNNVLN